MSKKVAAVHDLSCFGRSSLTVVIPILSAMGIQVCPVPTALLSTHTGGFPGYTLTDLTDEMQPLLDHWQALDLHFDCLYSGYLGSPKQIAIVSDMFDRFGSPNTLVLVDPVMGDNGKLYSSMSPEMVPEMRKLLAKSDIVTPNLTEACFLTGRPYDPYPSPEESLALVRDLAAMGPRHVVITSIHQPDDQALHILMYDRAADHLQIHSVPFVDAHYPGTGDAFCSVLLGAVLQDVSLRDAAVEAASFLSTCLEASVNNGAPHRNGIELEQHLNLLTGQ